TENVDIDLGRHNDINAENGIGILALAGGDVDIEGRRGDVYSDGPGIIAGAGGNVWIDIDEINSANGAGILAGAGENIDIDLYGNITANGLVGIGAVSGQNTNID